MDKSTVIWNLIKQFCLQRFVSSLLQAFGILWLLIEVTAYFFSNRPWVVTIKSGWWVFLIAGVMIGLYRAWPRLSVKERISDTDTDVQVSVGDIFSQPHAIIIGSNNTFDTSMDDKTISHKSLQGQFTQKYCPSIPELDKQLDSALQNVSPISTRNNQDKPYGKSKEYELGTVAPIDIGGKQAYFVAIAVLNEHRVATSDRDDFLDSLPRMWAEVRRRGEFEPLCCPVLGSGFSRLNLTREELIREIIKSFVTATVEAKFCEKLTVIISPKDFREGHVDLQKVGRFLEHECIYARSISKPKGTSPIGTPIA